MSDFVPPPASDYTLPTLARRAVGLVVVVVLGLLFFVVLPQFVSRELGTFQLPFPYDLAALSEFGLLLTVLAGLRTFFRPSRLLGPVGAAYHAALIVYLLWLAGASSLRLNFGNGGLSIGFAELLLLLAIVPAIGLAGDLVTGFEDLTRPTERYPIDFPPKPRPSPAAA